MRVEANKTSKYSLSSSLSSVGKTYDAMQVKEDKNAPKDIKQQADVSKEIVIETQVNGDDLFWEPPGFQNKPLPPWYVGLNPANK